MLPDDDDDGDGEVVEHYNTSQHTRSKKKPS